MGILEYTEVYVGILNILEYTQVYTGIFEYTQV